MSLKITTWNLENCGSLIKANLTNKDLERRERILSTIDRINPDILCIQEGPKGEQAIVKFSADALKNRWVPVLLDQSGANLGQRDPEYCTEGDQWIWFLVKPEHLQKCSLQPPLVWQNYVGKDWTVHWWGSVPATKHHHYRHPQVLKVKLGEDEYLELVGVHLKSKINMLKPEKDAAGNLTGPFLDRAMSNRIKMTTEAVNIRRYVEHRFDQTADPGIVIMGDCNDGPGRDIFEEHYMYLDLVNNLEGDTMLGERYFNHALFDFPKHLCWTTKFDDKLTGEKAEDNPVLLDHILMSQPLCRGKLSLVVNEYAGRVEHEAFDVCNAGATAKSLTSDHRPVSCRLDPT